MPVTNPDTEASVCPQADRLQELGRRRRARRGPTPSSSSRRASASTGGGRATAMTTAAMANRTARKSAGGTCSTRSRMRKNVEPQTAVTPTSSSVAQARAHPAASGHPGLRRRRGDVLPLGACVPAAGSELRTVPKKPPRTLLDAPPRSRRPRGSARPRRPACPTTSGTSTSAGPLETTSVTLSPLNRVPPAGPGR